MHVCEAFKTRSISNIKCDIVMQVKCENNLSYHEP